LLAAYAIGISHFSAEAAFAAIAKATLAAAVLNLCVSVFIVFSPFGFFSFLVCLALSKAHRLKGAHIIVRMLPRNHVSHKPTRLWPTCQANVVMAKRGKNTARSNLTNQRQAVGRGRSKAKPLFFSVGFKPWKKRFHFFAQQSERRFGTLLCQPAKFNDASAA
jgi:hypothetical protein